MNLKEMLAAPVSLPGDPDFADLASAWNRAIPQQPAAVVQVRNIEDVCVAVRAARELGLPVSAQAGGHGATTQISGSVLIRTRGLDEIRIDSASVRVGAGVKWGELVAALPDGRIALVGSNIDVSVIGYLLGGGLSWFGRKHGMAASSVRAVELVDATGELVRVTDESDPELMWALRGGGGEFGIVTAIELDTFAEPELHGGKILFPVTHAAAVLRAFRQVTATAPDGLTVWAQFIHYPDAPFLPEPVRGQSFIDVTLTWLGSAAELAEPLSLLTAAAPVLMNNVGPITIAGIGEVAAEPNDPLPFLDWGSALREFDDATLDRFVETFTDRERTPLLTVQLRHLGGALGGPVGSAAFTHLPGAYSVYALGVPFVPEQVEPIQQGMVGLQQLVRDVDLDVVTPNFAGTGSVTRAFDSATLAKLRQVKRRVDPDGVIRGNHPLG